MSTSGRIIREILLRSKTARDGIGLVLNPLQLVARALEVEDLDYLFLWQFEMRILDDPEDVAERIEHGRDPNPLAYFLRG